jgi:hypothetical protein
MILTFLALSLAQASNFQKVLNDEIAAPMPRPKPTEAVQSPASPPQKTKLTGDRARVFKACGVPPQWSPGASPWARAQTWGYPFREDGAECRVHFHFEGERLTKKDLGEGCVLMGPHLCRDLEP